MLQKLFNAYSRLSCKREFKHQEFNGFNERPVEYSFVFRKLAEIYPQTILDVGTGTTSLPHMMRYCGNLVTAVDNITDYWGSGMVNRHYHVINDDITRTGITDTFDMVTCISVLEHIKEADTAIKNMFSLLKRGGHLVLTFPYNEKEYVPNVYDLPESIAEGNKAYKTQSFSRKNINEWLKNNNASIVEQEYWRFWEGQYWTCGQKIIPPLKTTASAPHQHTCLLIKNNV